MAGGSPPRTRFLSLRVRPWGLLGASAALLGMATVAGFLGCLWWPLDLAAHFRVQYAVGSSILTAAYLIGRRWRELAACVLLAVVNGALLIPLYRSPAASASPAGGASLRLLLVNVNTHHGDPAKVGAYVRQVDPDVLVLEEVSLEWLAALRDLRERFLHRVVEPRGDNFGIGLWCRVKPVRAEVVSLGPADVPSVVAEVPIGSAVLGILATHPLPPGGEEETSWRDRQLSEVAQHLRRQRIPFVLLGDLNVTPWSCAYRRLVRDAALRRAARGIAGTWPVGLLPLRIPIDHALCSAGVRVDAARVGPDVGSDHFPLVVEVGVEDRRGPHGEMTRQAAPVH